MILYGAVFHSATRFRGTHLPDYKKMKSMLWNERISDAF